MEFFYQMLYNVYTQYIERKKYMWIFLCLLSAIISGFAYVIMKLCSNEKEIEFRANGKYGFIYKE